MARSFDVVIIGGGVIGSSIAYFLSSNPDFGGTVAVIERDPAYTISSSSLSASSIRQQFGTPPNIAMSAFGIGFLRRARELLSVEDNEADIGLRERGYLILGTEDKVSGFTAKHEVHRANGVAVDLMSPEALGQRFPWLNTADLGIGSFGTDREGTFDGPALLQAFKRKARSLAATYIHADVAGLEKANGGITGVKLSDGEMIGAGLVVNAAGAWSGAVMRMAGHDLPVVPRKRCVFVFDSPERIENGPFLFDSSGIWMRPEGQLYLCGVNPEIENADDDYSLDVDYDLFDDIIWPALANRVPGFEQLRMLRAWAGHYEYNLFDHSAIIGPHPDIPNLILATGFSGHGMMHSAGAGVGVSEIIAYGRSRTVDVSPFAIERIALNHPIEEHVY